MTVRNLISGQYQIGELVFGNGTTVPVDDFDAKPYDINAQDMQMQRQDEILFNQDQLKPSTIDITFSVRYNWLLPHYEGSIPNFWDDMPKVEDFAREWKADEIRRVPDATKPLYVCDRDGLTKVVYGRPGKFTHAKNTNYTEAVECIGEFRRLDTFAYGLYENAISLAGGPKTINGTNGDGPSWFRILVSGAAAHPVFTISQTYDNPNPVTIDLNYSIPAGRIVEISSYPWQRRVINDATPPINLAANLVGLTPYLDRLRFGHNQSFTISMTGATDAVLLYYDAYQVIS